MEVIAWRWGQGVEMSDITVQVKAHEQEWR